MEMIRYTSIGVIRTPFKTLDGMPIQPTGAVGVKGRVELFDDYLDGLQDLEGFSHLILIYHFHLSKNFKLKVVPFLDRTLRGLFATRAPNRPNAVGISIVELDRIEGAVLYIQNVDMINNTPLLDIKPYVPVFDRPISVRIGWLETAAKAASVKKADKRFF